MPELRKLRVFLCHASQDKPIVRELYQRILAEAWIDPWLDEEKLLPGQDWDMEIEKAVEAADAVIVFLSSNSISKEGYIQRELRKVLDVADEKPEGAIFVIPLRLDYCKPPRRLNARQYLDFFPKNQQDWAYERLNNSLKELCVKHGIHVGNTKWKSVSSQLHVEIKSIRKKWGNLEFMLIPGGAFIMGSNETDKESFDIEKEKHILEIPNDYWMARYPITNEQYSEYEFPKYDWQTKKKHPVTKVTWEDAMNYCRWFNRSLEGSLPSGMVLRLPTEAEWEKAARGSNGNIYPWGNQFDEFRCNTDEGGIGNTTPVGKYSPYGDSPYGCADMSGNVWEWTHSLSGSYPYKLDDGRENEHGTGNHILRGGCFLFPARYARCAFRNRGGIVGNLLDLDKGFRVVIASPID